MFPCWIFIVCTGSLLFSDFYCLSMLHMPRFFVGLLFLHFISMLIVTLLHNNVIICILCQCTCSAIILWSALNCCYIWCLCSCTLLHLMLRFLVDCYIFMLRFTVGRNIYARVLIWLLRSISKLLQFTVGSWLVVKYFLHLCYLLHFYEDSQLIVSFSVLVAG